LRSNAYSVAFKLPSFSCNLMTEYSGSFDTPGKNKQRYSKSKNL
jgi:hypothetical protein